MADQNPIASTDNRNTATTVASQIPSPAPVDPIKKQELENQQLVRDKTRLEIEGLQKANRSDWTKPTTWFGALTALALIAGIIAGAVWSKISYERAQVAADRAELKAERTQREVEKIELQRDKAREERDQLMTEATTHKAEIVQLRSDAESLQKQIEELDGRAKDAAITLVGVEDPLKLLENQSLCHILDTLKVTVIYVTNMTDRIAEVSIGQLAHKEDQDKLAAALELSNRFSATRPAPGSSLSSKLQPHATVRFAVSHTAYNAVITAAFWHDDTGPPLIGPGIGPLRPTFARYDLVERVMRPVEVLEFDGGLRRRIDGKIPAYDPLSKMVGP